MSAHDTDPQPRSLRRFFLRGPWEIVASVAGSEIGDSIHISDITLPDGVTPTITDRDFTVATIAAPTVVEEETTTEEGEEGVMPEGEAGVEGEAATAETKDGEEEKSGDD